MTLAAIVSNISKECPRFEPLSDEALQEWAIDAVRIFNAPPAGPSERLVELIGRALADLLRERVGERLAPSLVRIRGALQAVLGLRGARTQQQLAMWAEVISHYLSESPALVPKVNT